MVEVSQVLPTLVYSQLARQANRMRLWFSASISPMTEYLLMKLSEWQQYMRQRTYLEQSM